MGRIHKKAGTTLLELVVCFALVAILMAAAVACVSPIMRMYYRIQSTSQAQAVADALLQNIRAEVQSARGGQNESDLYIKLRDGDGKSVALDPEKGMTGVTLEFLCSAQSSDGLELLHFVEQIDCRGLSALQGGAQEAVRFHKNSGSPDADLENYQQVYEDFLPEGYLAQRFYSPNNENAGRCRDRCELNGETLPMFYDAQRVYAEGSYMGYTMELRCVIPPNALAETEPDSGIYTVRYLKVELTLRQSRGPEYTVEGVIQLTNRPVYNGNKTMESDQI